MRGLTDRSAPDERRRVAASMKDALIHAKMALQDLRSAIATTEQRVAGERKELETVERRLGLAAGINDAETVTIAERFRAQHAERLMVLETKLMSQQQELTLGERELEDMTVQMRRALSGLPINDPRSTPEAEARREVESALAGDDLDVGLGASDSAFPSGEPPRRTRAEKEAVADERLAALKRRMGK
ncbi:MAG: hypothetical protein ABJC26_00485 [Gemmatimonadaceae bacterium]